MKYILNYRMKCCIEQLRGIILVTLKNYLKTMLIQTVTTHIFRYVNYTLIITCVYNYSLIILNYYNLHIQIIIIMHYNINTQVYNN